uniref:Uncharacterized protein n=1 Tax=Anguilla anguilla TaxID=7936 RepID=A0A0E9THY6_ANGAN
MITKYDITGLTFPLSSGGTMLWQNM